MVTDGLGCEPSLCPNSLTLLGKPHRLLRLRENLTDVMSSPENSPCPCTQPGRGSLGLWDHTGCHAGSGVPSLPCWPAPLQGRRRLSCRLPPGPLVPWQPWPAHLQETCWDPPSSLPSASPSACAAAGVTHGAGKQWAGRSLPSQAAGKVLVAVEAGQGQRRSSSSNADSPILPSLLRARHSPAPP